MQSQPWARKKPLLCMKIIPWQGYVYTPTGLPTSQEQEDGKQKKPETQAEDTSEVS